MDTPRSVEELCAQHRLDYKQLAERAGLDEQRVLAIVLGRWTPSPQERDKVAAAFGLTPLCPPGILGTLLTMQIRPVWKPAAPKRFAWTLGGSLGVVCLAMRLSGVANVWIIGVVAICFVLTWLEAVLGFCVGCWMYSLLFECEVCELPYRPGDD